MLRVVPVSPAHEADRSHKERRSWVTGPHSGRQVKTKLNTLGGAEVNE